MGRFYKVGNAKLFKCNIKQGDLLRFYIKFYFLYLQIFFIYSIISSQIYERKGEHYVQRMVP